MVYVKKHVTSLTYLCVFIYIYIYTYTYHGIRTFSVKVRHPYHNNSCVLQARDRGSHRLAGRSNQRRRDQATKDNLARMCQGI